MCRREWVYRLSVKGLTMDGKRDIEWRISIKRAYDHSRLGPQSNAAAYENLLPLKQAPVSNTSERNHSQKKEKQKWAM